MAVDLADYIRRAALARGIDPDIALRVAKGEGGLNDPFRRGEGPAPKSQAAGLGSTENSYGPFQLYVSGNGAGLGDKALAAGIDPRKDWQAGVDFALDQARAGGWGPWYGAKAAGITGKMGIGGAPSTPISSQIAARPNSPPQASGTPAPPLQSYNVQDHPIMSMAPTPDVPASVVAAATPQAQQRTPWDIMGQMAAMAPQQPQFQPVEIRGPSPEQAQALTSFINALKQRVA